MGMDMEIDIDKKKKKRQSDTTPTSSKRNKSQDHHLEELKGSDEAFNLSVETIYEIIQVILSGETDPNIDELEWDAYATSFYIKTLKAYTSFPNKEQTASEEEEEDVEVVGTILLSESEEEEDADIKDTLLSSELEEDCFCRPALSGPFDFGSYAHGEEPKQIPYHLYLLVKEAVDIIKSPEYLSNNPDAFEKLSIVEDKIWFFYFYFHCHLPTGWKYSRDTAATVVESYDPTHQPRYNLDHYTPTSISEFDVNEYDETSDLPRDEMVRIMNLVHSRKTLAYWVELDAAGISFYCKLCSCFGLDYLHLETASADDVSLMYVGKLEKPYV